ncbi:transposase, partial [Brochothrix campestris FSL F6-1037]
TKNSNGILRRNGLPKKMDFNQVDQNFISAVASKKKSHTKKIIKLPDTIGSVFE